LLAQRPRQLRKVHRFRRASSCGQLIEDVESHTEGSILASMERAATLLSPVQESRIWRVRIVWANGAIHHFGKFNSEQEAIKWIDAHPRLTRPVLEKEEEPSLPRKRVRFRKRLP